MSDWYDRFDSTLTAVRTALFAVLTGKEKAAAAHHCGAPGDGPDAFPVPDAAHARAALSRAHFSSDPAHVRACVARVVKEEGWDVEVSMGVSVTVPLAHFASTAADGDTEELRGLAFRCGDYPDQNFSLTEAEADALIAEFTPVESRHGHPRSAGPLDGKMGTLIGLTRQGSELHGRFAVPKWLTALIPPAERKISLGFAQVPKKRIVEWSWVVNPIISDAQLEAAFAGSRHSALDQHLLDDAAQKLAMAGATLPAATRITPSYYAEEQRMDTTTSGAPTSAQLAAQQEQLRQDREAFTRERAAFARTQYWGQAEQKVIQLISDKHLLPSANIANSKGKPRLTALYAEAFARDAAGAAIFADSLGGSLVSELDAVFGGLSVPVAPTDETVQILPPDRAAGQGQANAADQQAALDARIEKLLAESPLGLQTLAARQNGHK